MRVRTIAFAYCESTPELNALYSGLLPGMVKNMREMTEAPILQLSDEHTPIVKGVSAVLRIDKLPLMVWRMKAHQMAHSQAEEIYFVEPDVRLRADVLDVFEQSFDIAITPRETGVMWGDEALPTYTLGSTFSRSDEFWREAKIYCQTLPERDQHWIGDLRSVAHVIEGGKYRVVELDPSIYNHIPNELVEKSEAKVLHYKGKRKSWLFPQIVEG